MKLFLIILFINFSYSLSQEQLDKIKSKTQDYNIAPNFTLNSVSSKHFDSLKNYIINNLKISNSINDSIYSDNNGNWYFDTKNDTITASLYNVSDGVDIENKDKLRLIYDKQDNTFSILTSSANSLIDSEKISLHDLKGKVVLINFWATWCGPCRIEIPDLNELYKNYYDKGFELLGISISDNKNQLMKFKKAYNVEYPLLWGSQNIMQNILLQYGGVYSVPMSFLINSNSEIIRVYPGAILKQYDQNMYTDLVLNIERALSEISQ